MKTLLLILLLSPIFVYSQTEATILLRGNKEYKVTILERGDKEIKVRTDKGAEVTILRENILSIDEGCKYKKNEVDDMTGEAVLITTEQLLVNRFGFGSLSAKGYSVSGAKVLALNVSLLELFSIPENSKILVKAGDEVHEFINPVFQIADKQLSAGYEVNLELSLKDYHIEALLDNPVTKVRVYSKQGQINFDIKEKNQMKIAKVLNCIQ